MNHLTIRNQWWADSVGMGPNDEPENRWAATVSLSLRLDGTGDAPSLIVAVVSGIIEFDGDNDADVRLSKIVTNHAGLAADDLVVLLPAVHHLFGAPPDDDMTSQPIDLDTVLRPVFHGRADEVIHAIRGYKDQLSRNGVRQKGRLYRCVPE